jgi:tetratricopeptide (TPR) repeat protein
VIVEDNSRKAPPAASKPAVVKETPKIIPKPVTQSQNGATQTLLARANEALASQQPETAIMLLERAVRIEPREALLWIRLSRAHLAQGEMRAAFQHARKAIALAGSDSSKFSAAWLQLANVFTAQGKNAEAQQIRRRFSRSSG